MYTMMAKAEEVTQTMKSVQVHSIKMYPLSYFKIRLNPLYIIPQLRK